ncbi:tetratricopeptide repeat protein [Rhodoferax bucti]|uniref:tetratricopeptide repeat protein n=1 Tax=Rhodoferax bucti TaxID=2576305 RepID=UPI001109C4E3
MPNNVLALPDSLASLNALSPEDWQSITADEPMAAAAWMQAAAHLGHGDAQSILGQWLLDGHGVERNPQEALGWFLKAGKQGHIVGINMAGRCFENGWGTPPDAFAAVNWYRQAAHKGLEAGMYNYANMLATGRGVRKDPTAALEWYRRAARLGHAKSMTKIGHFYEDGRVVRRDVEAAFTWFEKGAHGGDFRGQFNYASMLAARGQLQQALEWLKKVPLTATPGYKRLAGEQLVQSPTPEFQAVGRQMLESLEALAP